MGGLIARCSDGRLKRCSDGRLRICPQCDNYDWLSAVALESHSHRGIFTMSGCGPHYASNHDRVWGDGSGHAPRVLATDISVTAGMAANYLNLVYGSGQPPPRPGIPSYWPSIYGTIGDAGMTWIPICWRKARNYQGTDWTIGTGIGYLYPIIEGQYDYQVSWYTDSYCGDCDAYFSAGEPRTNEIWIHDYYWPWGVYFVPSPPGPGPFPDLPYRVGDLGSFRIQISAPGLYDGADDFAARVDWQSVVMDARLSWPGWVRAGFMMGWSLGACTNGYAPQTAVGHWAEECDVAHSYLPFSRPNSDQITFQSEDINYVWDALPPFIDCSTPPLCDLAGWDAYSMPPANRHSEQTEKASARLWIHGYVAP